MHHQYRIGIPAEVYLTIRFPRRLNKMQLETLVDDLISDDGARVPELPEGVVYVKFPLKLDVVDETKGRKQRA